MEKLFTHDLQRKRCSIRSILFLMMIMLCQSLSSQTYTIDPSGWIDPPTNNVTNGNITLHGGLILLKATILGNDLSFNIKKKDGSVFQNKITVQIRKNSATGTILKSEDYGGGYSLISCSYGTIDFTGSKTFVIVLKSKASSGDIWYYTNPVTITVEENHSEAPTVITKSATEVHSTEAIIRGTLYPNGLESTYYFKYGTSRSSLNYSTNKRVLANTEGSYPIQANITDLSPSTTYYFRAVAYNDAGSDEGDILSFTTESAGNENHLPDKPSNPSPYDGAQDQPTQGVLSWSCYDEDDDDIRYSVYLGTSSSNMSHLISTYDTYCSYSGLEAGKTYYWYVQAIDDFGSTNGKTWSFTTESNSSDGCDFIDVPKTNAFYDATCYLYRLNVLSGSDQNGKMEVESNLKRAHLAKIAFRGVYSIKGRSVPSTVPSDYFPTIYNDLTDNTTYYYQAARALLYLEYDDGVAPFDRNRFEFSPEETIARIHVLKVLMETFNIQPDYTGTNNPFPSDADVVSIYNNNPRMMGYIRKAASLGIITTGRPYDKCLRGEAFTMLARIMQKVDSGDIKDPNPNNADYFQPLNTTLATISLGIGFPLGNFNHYTKTSFAIDGTVPLNFAHTYNSYNTTLPEVFYGINNNGDTYQPLGDGWSHNYHTFITIPTGFSGSDTRLAVHWGGGSIDVYKSNGPSFVPVSSGVYDEMSLVGKEIVIKTKSQMEYHFSGSSSGGTTIYYLSSVKDRNGNTETLTYETVENGMKRILSVSDGNRSLSFSYRSNTNLLESVSDPLGRSIKFDYTFNKKLNVTS